MFSVKKDKAAATSVVVVGGVSKEGPALAAGKEEELGQENKLDVAMSKEEKVRVEEKKDSSFQPTMTTAATAATNGNKNNKSLTKAILDPTKNIGSSSSLQWKILQPLEEKEEQKNKEKNAFQLQRRVSYCYYIMLLLLVLKNECRSFKSRLILVVAGMAAAKAFYLFLT